MSATADSRPLPEWERVLLAAARLAEYKHLDARWHDWSAVQAACARAAAATFDLVCKARDAGGCNEEGASGAA